VAPGAILASRGRRRSIRATTYAPLEQRSAGGTPMHLLGLHLDKSPVGTQ
jgi:hypothetical protein